MRSRLNRFFVVLFILFLYTGFALSLSLPSHPMVAWLSAGVLFQIMVGWQFGYRSGKLAADSKRLVLFAWLGNLTIGAWGTFLLLNLPLHGFSALLWIAQRFFGLGLSFNLSRWNQESALAVLVASFFITFVGLWQAVRGPRIKRVNVSISGMAKELHGLKIVQISDLHVGPTIRKAYVENVVLKMNALAPDLIAFTGDFGDGVAADLEKHWQPLAGLSAPLGLFYVNGNHEYYWKENEWAEAAVKCGFTALKNESRLLSYRNRTLTVAGVTDSAAEHFDPLHRPDPKKAIIGGEASDLKILLSHRPDACVEAEKAGFQLQLSGHTHSGQFFPFIIFQPFVHKYFRGLNQHLSLWVYVNAGTGYWGPPNRFGIPSEITLLTIVTA